MNVHICVVFHQGVSRVSSCWSRSSTDDFHRLARFAEPPRRHSMLKCVEYQYGRYRRSGRVVSDSVAAHLLQLCSSPTIPALHGHACGGGASHQDGISCLYIISSATLRSLVGRCTTIASWAVCLQHCPRSCQHFIPSCPNALLMYMYLEQ